MNLRYIKGAIIISLIVLLVGCNNARNTNKSSKISNVESSEKNTNTKKNKQEKKSSHMKNEIEQSKDETDVSNTQKILDKIKINKTTSGEYNTFAKKYANLSDESMDFKDWWLYTEYENGNKPYIYRFNIKTGNKVRVCEGKIIAKTPLLEEIHYVNETGIKLLHNNQKINLINKHIDQYQMIENGYVYVASNAVYYFNTTTNTESILTTFNDSVVVEGELSAASNKENIIYSIKTNDRILLNIYNIKNKENKTILENQFCNNIINHNDKFFLFNDSSKKILIYENDKLKELVIKASSYPKQDDMLYSDDKIYFSSDKLYIIDTNDYSIKTIDTYSSENSLLEIKDNKLYLYGNQLMIYYIDQDRLENKNIFLDLSKEIFIDNDSIYEMNRDKGYICKSNFKGKKDKNYSLDYFTDYFIGDSSIYLLDDKGIISKVDKETLDTIETTRKYDNSYIYQVRNKQNTNIFRVENYNASVHLNENTYYPSSAHRLISLQSNKKALEELKLSNSDWYDYNDKFIVYVNESGLLHYYNRYTKEKKSLKVSNINKLRIIDNSIFYYSIDDKALFCYKNNRHKKIVDGNIEKYEVIGNKIYYEDKYLYRIDINGTNKEKINDSPIRVLISIENDVFYINNKDISALYKINNNSSSELIDIIPSLDIKDYFTDGEKLYIYYNDKDVISII